jgi:predicted dienelactone hydrolase
MRLANLSHQSLAHRLPFLALATSLLLLAASNVACGDAVFKVGVTTRDLVPAEPYDWRGTKAHALRAVIWYPAAADAREGPQWIGPPIFPFFSAGSAAPNAPAIVGSRRPLILLSHGNGGAGLGLAWIGTALAAHGFIVAAVDHPGNNSNDGTTVEGFSLFWLRAVDLRSTINAILDDKSFGSLVDASRIGAAGHSYGGYTVIAAGGGIADPSLLEAFCSSTAADSLCKQPDVSDMRNKRLARLSSDPDFRQRYSEAGKSYRDERIRAVLAMAPGPGPVFTQNSLREFTIPIAIVSGSADDITPPRTGAEALAKAIPNATLKLFPRAGHFVFLNACTTVGRLVTRVPCGDPDGADRQGIHADTIKIAVDFFTANLR